MDPPTFRIVEPISGYLFKQARCLTEKQRRGLKNFSTTDLSERQRYGLAFIRHRGRLNNNEYCRINDCDSREATNELSELVKRKIVEQHGTRRWTFYTLPEAKPGIQPELRTRGNRRVDILKAIGGKGDMSRKEIQDELKMPSVTVLYWLRRLIRDKKIERTTNAKNPNVRYRLKA